VLTPSNNLLTVDGWKNVTELNVGDEILTTNFAGHGIFSPILNITEYDYDGYIYEHVNIFKRQGGIISHFSLTEDSVLPIRKTLYRKSVLTGNRIAVEQIDTVKLNTLTKDVQAIVKSPLQFSMKDKRHQAGVIKNGSVDMSEVEYFRFLAYAIMRGSIKYDRTSSSTVTMFRIREKDDPTRLMDLLDSNNIPYRISVAEKKGNLERLVILRSGAGAARSLKKFISKRMSARTLPKVIMRSTSPDAVYAFVTEILRIKKPEMDFDLGIPSKGDPLTFTLSNIELAEQLADLFFKIGYPTTITDRDNYIVLVVNRPKFARIKVEDIIKKKYTGKVYAVDVINEMAVCNPTNLGPRFSMVVKLN